MEKMDYEALLELFNEFDGDTLAQQRVARTYLNRARKENDSVKVARGYDRLARIYTPEKNILYADSLIAYTQDWDHITYPTMGYILKAYELGRMNEIIKRYNNLTTALEYAKRRENVSQLVYILGEISTLRNKWGSFEKANSILTEKLRIIKSQDYIIKLKKCTRLSRHAFLDEIKENQLFDTYKEFVINYIGQNKYDQALNYLDTLRILVDASENDLTKEENILWIKDAEVELSYFKMNYPEVIKKSEKLIDNENYSNHEIKYLNTYLFRGLAEFELGNYSESENYLDKVEKNSDVLEGYHNEYLKLLFQTKFKLMKRNLNMRGQLYYLDRLLKIDSLNAAMFRALEPKMIYEMDTVKLLDQKDELISELNNLHRTDKIKISIVGLMLTLTLSLAYYYYRQKIVFKKRFQILLEKGKESVSSYQEKKKTLSLSEDIVSDILQRLERFEEQKAFLNPEISLTSLAKEFHTNSSYLSRVLNFHMEKNFSQYLNELRVNHAMSEIKHNPNFRKYTIEAIAAESGYKNAASFSRAFYRITGIYPSYYINNLNKIKD